ncbi:MAG TPA: DUF885 domain-containing protein [Thermoplasmata archaeon]|nr:DUF885 domain-containing protein [Thermoplasmata archaeon]
MATSRDLDALEREIVDHLFELQPSYAVALGLHDYDGRSPDLSPGATDRWASTADRLLARLGEVDPDVLTPDRQIDRFLLRLLLESPLFDLRDARDLERNPMAYVGMFSLTSYLARDYAPAEARVEAMAKILLGAPAILDTGRSRLDGPLPRPFVDLALEMGGQLPSHFAEVEEFASRHGLASRIAPAREVAESSLRGFLAWLKEVERPRATADFALGPDRFRKLLFVREGIEIPVEEIREAGLADLHRNQARLEEIAREASRPPTALVAALADDHPRPDEVLSTAREYVDETRAFVAAKDLATIPEPAVCRVEETPPYARAWTTASMSPPGPFDAAAAQGIYFVTLVDPSWSPRQQQEWLRQLNRPMLRNITVHEVYPGHYLQSLHFRARPASLARKVYGSPSFVEGWAHYAEQLAIEAGLDGGRREAEVAQLHDALLRNCRLLSSIGLHTAQWPVDQATELFRTEAHFEQLPAEREAIRGTFNPEYFCYTLGKLSILSARRRFLASKFRGSLRAFHDALLSSGAPPVGLIDRVLELHTTA